MEADTSIATPTAEKVDESGICDDNSFPVNEGQVSAATEQAEEIHEAVQAVSSIITSELPDGPTNGGLNSCFTGEITEQNPIHEEMDLFPTSGEIEAQQKKHQAKNFSRQNGQGKAKDGKPVSSKMSVGVEAKKTDGKKGLKADSNGTLSGSSRLRQPTLGSKSFNDRNLAAQRGNKIMKPAVADSGATKPTVKTLNMTVKYTSTNATKNAAQSEANLEKPKAKLLKQGPQPKVEGHSEADSSPRSEDSRQRREGKLPSYDINFRCNERAEKRREFLSKLEEKIHAKEEEISNQEAKSKETQAAEIKMLRKSLNFKATPMPSFYQLPQPPKVEIKKKPTTRARSPKLGRKKGTSTAEGEGNDNGSYSRQPGRLSLGAENPPNKTIKGTSAAQQKSHRASLPRLPSEKTTLPSKASNKLAKGVAKLTMSGTQKELGTTATSEAQKTSSVPKIEPVDMADEADGEPHISSDQVPVIVEN